MCLKSSANTTEIFCWNWSVVLSTVPFIEHVLTDNENKFTVIQKKYFSTENKTPYGNLTEVT